MEEKSLEMANAAIQKIKGELSANDVIKDYEMPPLVNYKSGKTVGFAVQMLLNTKYDYSDAVFEDWKKQLSADDWYFNVRRNQLRVYFNVRFDSEEK